MQISARVLKEFGREPRVIVGQEPIHEPTRVIVNVKRDAESDAAVELFGSDQSPRFADKQGWNCSPFVKSWEIIVLLVWVDHVARI